jgi:hypothetical protein
VDHLSKENKRKLRRPPFIEERDMQIDTSIHIQRRKEKSSGHVRKKLPKMERIYLMSESEGRPSSYYLNSKHVKYYN